MAVVIKNEVDFKAYLTGLIGTEGFENLKAVEYIDANEDLDDWVGNYFENKYKGGVVLFLGLYEGFFEDNGNYARCQLYGQLSMMVKYKQAEKDSKIIGRRDSRELLIRLLLHLKGISQDKYLSGDVAGHYEFVVDQNKLMPVGNVANVDAVGCLADFEMIVEMDRLR